MRTNENKKKSNVFNDILDMGGCLLQAIVGLVVLCAIVVVVSKCQNRHSKTTESHASYIAWRDSIKRAEEEIQAQYAKECTEHRQQYFSEYSKKNLLFESFEAFNEWMDRANYAAIELLYSIYHPTEFNGDDGIERFAEYLYYAPHVYDIQCERCGEVVEFIGFEEE